MTYEMYTSYVLKYILLIFIIIFIILFSLYINEKYEIDVFVPMFYRFDIIIFIMSLVLILKIDHKYFSDMANLYFDLIYFILKKFVHTEEL